MVIKIGFSSNSSSSSFIIFGSRIEPYQLNRKNIENIWAAGTYLGDGQDVFPLDCHMLEVLEKNPSIQQNLDFFFAYKTVSEYDEDHVEKAGLPDKFGVYSFNKDYWSTSSVQDLTERYVEKGRY